MWTTTIYCKYCHQRLFDITPDTRGRIEIKCPRCRKVVGVAIWKEELNKGYLAKE